jgi:DNA-binding GntR family transcriptional regulator
LHLKDRAFRELRALLLSGEFPAGTLLSERQLVARFKISKTPIRVALERLERDGFVEILPQRGVRVVGLSDKAVADHFDLRIALETWVVDRLGGAAGEIDWSGVEESLERQRRAVDKRDVDAYAHADADFHDRLAVLTGNDEVVRVIRLQRERLFRIILRILEGDPGRPSSSLDEHVSILEALKQGDSALAADRMRDHLVWGRRFLVSSEDQRAIVPSG